MLNIYCKGFGVGGGVILKFVENLPAGPFQNYLPHSLYADNFFLSIKLIDQLTKMNVGVTGTMRANCIDKCPLVSAKKLKSQERGSYAIQYDDEINEVLICRYHDNAIVTVVSNWETVSPVIKAERYSRSLKRKVKIDQPQLLKNYNKYMGGTDRCNQNTAKYRVNVHGKKWYLLAGSYMGY